MYRAELVGSVKVDRSAGSGTCGIEPWRVRDCAEPKYWWGYRLEASMKAPLLVVPSDGSWVITNQPDTVVQYGLNPEELTSEGAYTAAEIDFGEERSRCSGTLVGRPFGVQVTGRLKNGQIQLLLAADPVEKLDATCSQKPVSAETHVLLAGWATALSGDPNDLTLFYDPESLSEDGLEYKRTVDSRTNPSPDMRDHAHTEMVFRCLKADEPHEVVACPWH